MKAGTKSTWTKLLAATLCVTAAAGTAVAVNMLLDGESSSPFKGVYGGSFTAFADSETTEESNTLSNLTMYNMMSQDGAYMLLATSIDNVSSYTALGYYITENGVSTTYTGDTYYTGIQVYTDEAKSSTATYYMSDIFGADYDYTNSGMIVYEVKYKTGAEYIVTPYLVSGTEGEEETIAGTSGIACDEYTLKNGYFETGDLTGWTLENDGNTDFANVSDANSWWDECISYNKDGSYFFSGYADGAAETATGTLTSSAFTVGGSGWITFKLGGGNNASLLRVEVLDAESNEVLAAYSNTMFSNTNFSSITVGTADEPADASQYGVYLANMVLYKADLSAFAGKSVKIRVVDSATSDWGLIFVDSFTTYYASEADLPADAVEAADIVAAQTALQTAVSTYGTVTDQGDYTEESYSAYTQALESAQSFLSAEGYAAASEYTSYATSLQKAYEALTVNVPEVNTAANTTVNVVLNGTATVTLSDFFDTKNLSSITYSVTDSEGTYTLDDETLTIDAASAAGTREVIVQVLYKDEAVEGVSVTLTVITSSEDAPTVNNATLTYNIDLYELDEDAKESLTIDLSENITNASNLSLTYYVKIGDGEEQVLEGSTLTFTYGDYDLSVETVIITVTVKVGYTANNTEDTISYTITLNLKDSTSYYTFSAQGVYATAAFSKFN